MGNNYSLVSINSNEEIIPHLTQYSNHNDSYLLSPNYFLLTGRKGLLAMVNGRNSIIFSDHPNLSNETIIFPPVNSEQASMLNTLLSCNSFPIKKKIRIIRCGQPESQLINSHVDEKFKLKNVGEYLLDWKYPSVWISVKNVISKKGKKFRDLRYNINRIDTSEIQFYEFNANQHLDDARDLVNKWSRRNVSSLFNEYNLSAPYNYLLNNLLIENNLLGYVLYYKKKFVSFNILDKPKAKDNELASLLFLADIDAQGIPSYMRYKVCKYVKSIGIEYIHIGGSETLGLYSFKKKFVPYKELSLFSVVN